MAIVLVHLIIHANVILDGLDLIVLLTVGVIIILPVMNNLELVINAGIGLLDNFVNTASKLNMILKLLFHILIQLFYFRAGSYGNATSPKGCYKCDCNGHGDEQLGICDSNSGKCYCKHYTQGDNCQFCKKGFFGDPK